MLVTVVFDDDPMFSAVYPSIDSSTPIEDWLHFPFRHHMISVSVRRRKKNLQSETFDFSTCQGQKTLNKLTHIMLHFPP